MRGNEAHGPDDYWLTGGYIFDGTGRERYRGDVRIAHGMLTDIVELDDREAPSKGRSDAIDSLTTVSREPAIPVSGATILPGLIDAHAHVGILSLSGQDRIPAPVQAAQVFANLASSLEQGFTTLRDLGGVDGGLVEAIEGGHVPGPRLLPSGQILSQTAGHGDLRGRYTRETCNPGTGAEGISVAMRLVDGVPEARRAAREQFRRGATQIKVFATGGVLSEGDPLESPQFSLDELRAIVEVAEDRDSYVTAHAHTVRGIQRALRAGVRCFEHGTMLDDETVGLLSDAGAAVIGTQTVSEVMCVDPASMGVPEAWLDDAAKVRDAAAQSLRKLYEAGVPVGSGADLVGADQTRRGWEIALRAQVLGASAAVQSSTRVNAEILGVGDTLGTVEIGKKADLTIMTGDPLARPELFRAESPWLVIKGGVVVAEAGRLARNDRGPRPGARRGQKRGDE